MFGGNVSCDCTNKIRHFKRLLLVFFLLTEACPQCLLYIKTSAFLQMGMARMSSVPTVVLGVGCPEGSSASHYCSLKVSDVQQHIAQSKLCGSRKD